MNISKDHIIQYLNGELPHHEQHEIEKMMLDDAFLSDAIDGLREIDDPEKLIESVKELEGFIEDNYGKVRKIIPLYRNPLAIAAVITFIFISISVVFFVPDYREKALSFLIPKEKNESLVPELQDTSSYSRSEVAEVQKESVDSALIPMESMEDATPDIAQELTPESDDISQIAEPAETTQLLAAEDVITDDEIEEGETAARSILSTDTIPDLLFEEDLVDNTEQLAETKDFEPQAATELGAPAAKKSVAMETSGQAMIGGNAISGVITSATTSRPLSGVNILLPGTSRGTIADGTGSYFMNVDLDESQIELLTIGYQSVIIDVSEPGIHNARMQVDESRTSEFMIIGNEGDKRLNEPDQFAWPASGRSAYNRYMVDNINYPTSASENAVVGQVILEFSVLSNGNISNVQVINSLGFGCDEEAKRLILEGPAWNPAIKNGTVITEQIRIAIRFGP